MTENKRFELYFDSDSDGWSIIDTKGEYVAEYYLEYMSEIQIVDLLNEQDERIKQLEKELKRCREWINSDKNDYELTLSFIKSKGFSLEDVLNYEKRKNGDVDD